MIDTHCHLDDERFDTDREAVVARAWRAGLKAIVVPGVHPSTWEALLGLPTREPRLWVALGIHPQALPVLPPQEDAEHLSQLALLLRRGGAVAVGECGLDGPSEVGAPMARQVSVLRAHLALARALDLPVLLHCHRAHPALRRLFEDEPPEGLRILLHSFSGGVDFARYYAKLGCYFSFAGPITYAGARKPLESLKAVPLDRLLLETDAPDQAPHPHRGQRSEPAFLRHVVEAAARVLDLPSDVLLTRLETNARALFRRPPEVR